ncbi:hypothetical protein JCM5296_005986 [Sporobolomyces johnsonii]
MSFFSRFSRSKDRSKDKHAKQPARRQSWIPTTSIESPSTSFLPLEIPSSSLLNDDSLAAPLLLTNPPRRLSNSSQVSNDLVDAASVRTGETTPWVDVNGDESPRTAKSLRLDDGSRRTTQEVIDPVRVRKEVTKLEKARLGVAEMTLLMDKCGEAIRSRGLTTLGLFRPYRLAESHSQIRILCLLFLDYAAEFDVKAVTESSTRGTEASKAVKLHRFKEELRYAQVHDVVGVLKWGLRHLTFSLSFSGSTPPSLDWYTTFLGASFSASPRHPHSSFSTLLLPSLPPSSASLLTSTLILLQSVSAFAEQNAMPSRKLCRSIGIYLFGLTWPEKRWDGGLDELYTTWRRAGDALEGCLKAFLWEQKDLPPRLAELVEDYPQWVERARSGAGDGGMGRKIRVVKVEVESTGEWKKAGEVAVNDQETGYLVGGGTDEKPLARRAPVEILLAAFESVEAEGAGDADEGRRMWRVICKKGKEDGAKSVLDEETVRVLELLGLASAKNTASIDEPASNTLRRRRRSFLEASTGPLYSLSEETSTPRGSPTYTSFPNKSANNILSSPRRIVTPNWNDFAATGFSNVQPFDAADEFGLFKPSKQSAPSRSQTVAVRGSSRSSTTVAAPKAKATSKIVSVSLFDLDEEFADVWLDTLVESRTTLSPLASWPSLVVAPLRSTLLAQLSALDPPLSQSGSTSLEHLHLLISEKPLSSTSTPVEALSRQSSLQRAHSSGAQPRVSKSDTGDTVLTLSPRRWSRRASAIFTRREGSADSTSSTSTALPTLASLAGGMRKNRKSIAIAESNVLPPPPVKHLPSEVVPAKSVTTPPVEEPAPAGLVRTLSRTLSRRLSRSSMHSSSPKGGQEKELPAEPVPTIPAKYSIDAEAKAVEGPPKAEAKVIQEEVEEVVAKPQAGDGPEEKVEPEETLAAQETKTIHPEQDTAVPEVDSPLKDILVNEVEFGEPHLGTVVAAEEPAEEKLAIPEADSQTVSHSAAVSEPASTTVEPTLLTAPVEDVSLVAEEPRTDKIAEQSAVEQPSTSVEVEEPVVETAEEQPEPEQVEEAVSQADEEPVAVEQPASKEEAPELEAPAPAVVDEAPAAEAVVAHEECAVDSPPTTSEDLVPIVPAVDAQEDDKLTTPASTIDQDVIASPTFTFSPPEDDPTRSPSEPAHRFSQDTVRPPTNEIDEQPAIESVSAEPAVTVEEPATEVREAEAATAQAEDAPVGLGLENAPTPVFESAVPATDAAPPATPTKEIAPIPIPSTPATLASPSPSANTPLSRSLSQSSQTSPAEPMSPTPSNASTGSASKKFLSNVGGLLRRKKSSLGKEEREREKEQAKLDKAEAKREKELRRVREEELRKEQKQRKAPALVSNVRARVKEIEAEAGLVAVPASPTTTPSRIRTASSPRPASPSPASPSPAPSLPRSVSTASSIVPASLRQIRRVPVPAEEVAVEPVTVDQPQKELSVPVDASPVGEPEEAPSSTPAVSPVEETAEVQAVSTVDEPKEESTATPAVAIVDEPKEETAVPLSPEPKEEVAVPLDDEPAAEQPASTVSEPEEEQTAPTPPIIVASPTQEPEHLEVKVPSSLDDVPAPIPSTTTQTISTAVVEHLVEADATWVVPALEPPVFATEQDGDHTGPIPPIPVEVASPAQESQHLYVKVPSSFADLPSPEPSPTPHPTQPGEPLAEDLTATIPDTHPPVFVAQEEKTNGVEPEQESAVVEPEQESAAVEREQEPLPAVEQSSSNEPREDELEEAQKASEPLVGQESEAPTALPVAELIAAPDEPLATGVVEPRTTVDEGASPSGVLSAPAEDLSIAVEEPFVEEPETAVEMPATALYEPTTVVADSAASSVEPAPVFVESSASNDFASLAESSATNEEIVADSSTFQDEADRSQLDPPASATSADLLRTPTKTISESVDATTPVTSAPSSALSEAVHSTPMASSAPVADDPFTAPAEAKPTKPAVLPLHHIPSSPSQYSISTTTSFQTADSSAQSSADEWEDPEVGL